MREPVDLTIRIKNPKTNKATFESKTYDKESIEDWIEVCENKGKAPTQPSTNLPWLIVEDAVVMAPNRDLEDEIRRYFESHPNHEDNPFKDSSNTGANPSAGAS